MKFKLPWLLMLAALCLPVLANAQTDALQRNEKGDVVLPSGNLGIGTADPRAKLEVHGRLLISGEQGKLIFPDGTTQHTAGVSGQGGERPIFENVQATRSLQVGENSIHLGWCRWNSSEDFNALWATEGPLTINSYAITQNPEPCNGLSFIREYQLGDRHTLINSSFANLNTGNVGIGLALNGLTLGLPTTDSLPTHKLHVRGQVRVQDGLETSTAANRLVIANTQGVLGRRDFTGNVNDVLRGDGTFGPGSGVSDPNAWKLTGNAGTNAATNFIGTTDNQSLSFRVNNQRAMRILSNRNVEIGGWGTNESSRLSIIGTSGLPQMTIFNRTGGGIYNYLQFESTGGGTSGYFSYIRSAKWELDVEYIVPLILKASGVGIGTETPQEELDVVGTINARTDAFVAGSGTYAINGNTVLRVPGTNNTLLGRSTGTTGISGPHNTFVGTQAGEKITSGEANTLVGSLSGMNMTTAVENVCVGHASGVHVTTGIKNVFIGQNSGNNWSGTPITTGQRNTMIGFGASTNGNLSYSAAIGSNALVTNSNTVALGRAGDIEGNGGDVTVCGYTAMPAPGVGLTGTAKGINRLGVNGNILMAGRLFQASDSRVKRNFTELKGALEKLEALKPLVYEYDTTVSLATSQKFMQADSAGRSHEVRVKHAFPRGPQMGFLAQDVAKVIPEAVQLGTDTSIAFMDQTALIPLLTQALKEEHAMVQNQQQQLKALEEKLDRLEKALAVCCAAQGLGKAEARPIGIQSVEPATELATETGADAPKLEQNSPNPFNSETEIRYFVPSKATQAMLLVTDAQGRVVLSRLATTGAGSWRIAAQTLQVGVYHYTLVIDGMTIATRKMVIVN